jgi:hypothetical protein
MSEAIEHYSTPETPTSLAAVAIEHIGNATILVTATTAGGEIVRCTMTSSVFTNALATGMDLLNRVPGKILHDIGMF